MSQGQVFILPVPVVFAIDDGAGEGKYHHIPDETYLIVKQQMPIFCVDVVAIDRTKQVFYLAQRREPPRQGWWWFGGRVGQDESPHRAASRILEREVGLKLESTRFKMVGVVFHYINEPNSPGRTFPTVQLAFEPTVEELATIRLAPSEYEAASGTRTFTRDNLVAYDVHSTVIAVYDCVFPPPRR